MRKTLLCFAASLFLMADVVRAQNADTGLSGSLEVNRQSRFYKDPNKAFQLAFFPGLLLHGYGHFYADDHLMGNVLLTGEVVSILSVGLGALIKSDTQTFSGGLLGPPQEADSVGSNLIWGGIIAFVGLWIVDMAHAPTSAKDYNDRHNLKPSFSLDPGRPSLDLALRF